MKGHLGDLMKRTAQAGRVEWIGIRPGRHEPMVELDRVWIEDTGLVGDRRETPGKRAVTLIQAEHLAVIAALAGLTIIGPEVLRRNIVVSGINLLSLRNGTFRIADVILQGSGLCAPCSRMETALGEGGYNAMRGHGGITASVVEPGEIKLGDEVSM